MDITNNRLWGRFLNHFSFKGKICEIALSGEFCKMVQKIDQIGTILSHSYDGPSVKNQIKKNFFSRPFLGGIKFKKSYFHRFLRREFFFKNYFHDRFWGEKIKNFIFTTFLGGGNIKTFLFSRPFWGGRENF